MAAKREKRTWFVEDESIFSLRPYTVRGWYPTGPAIHVPMTYEPASRFYAFGVANGEKEHYYFYTNKTRKTKKGKKNRKKKKKVKNLTAKMTLNFLKRLHKRYPKLLLVWDKATSHKAHLVQGYIETHGIKQEWFPTASSDENPMEQCWDFLKEAAANDHHPTIRDYKKAVKKQANKKNLTKMFKYLKV